MKRMKKKMKNNYKKLSPQKLYYLRDNQVQGGAGIDLKSS